MIEFPSILPSPLIDYSYDSDNSTEQTRFESGRVSQRGRFTSTRDIVAVAFKMTEIQLAIFEGFVANTLENGALEFYIYLPDAANREMTLQKVLLNKGQFKATAAAGSLVWSVTCTLIKQDKTTFSALLVYMLTIFGGDTEAMMNYAGDNYEAIQFGLYDALENP